MKIIAPFQTRLSKKIKKQKGHTFNYRALFLLIVFLFENTYPLLALSTNNQMAASNQASSEGAPVAEAALDMVDLFTGDFNYSVPLLSVPGPNGENVDLTASYNAGITVDEHAGLLGLGWSLNTGEITRQVVGAPDDFAGQSIATVKTSPTLSGIGDISNTFNFGPFYFNKINSNSAYQPTVQNTYGLPKYTTDNLVIESGINGIGGNNQNLSYNTIVNGNNTVANKFFPKYFAKPTAPFAMPAYDNYMVSGNGISGKIHPYIFSSSSSPSTYQHPVLYSGQLKNTGIRQNRKTQFYFEGSGYQGTYYMPHNLATNRLNSSNYVKYYTNAEINNNSNLFNNSNYVGFLDYHVVSNSSTRRPTSSYDANAIGGIEITNAEGFTYHYSLPVMVKSSVDKSFLNNGSSNASIIMTHKPSYAISWKLTAITGPDYKDFNNNKVADSGDIGYWVEYKYGLWSDSFYESSRMFGRNTGVSTRVSAGNSGSLRYGAGFNMNENLSEKYYIDYIRTSTHTAYFIKDIRLDEHSAELGQARPTVNPSLKLKKIVLLRNQQKSLIENSPNAWNTSGLNSKFATNLLTNPLDPTLIHINKYNLNKTNIDQASLKSVEFVQDYSLCKKYYLNINSNYGTVTATSKNLSGTTLTNFQNINCGSNVLYADINPASFTTTALNNSGKLTLNEIRSYEDGGVTVFSPYKFDYRATNAAKNPDFNPVKKDIWGYYKSDHDLNQTNTGYPTCVSAQNVDAWSLSKITLPEGGTIDVEYESDTYAREGFDDMEDLNRPTDLPVPVFNDIIGARNALRSPHYIYPIASSNFNVYPYSVTWENSDKTYIEALLMGGAGCPQVNNNSIYVVPILASCTSPLYAGSDIRDYPEFFIGWNSFPSANSPGLGKWPNIETYYCNSQHTFYQNYDKTKYYGYQLQAASWLYGGGLRVKSITLTETENSIPYKKEFTYYDGYCPAPPKPFRLGMAIANTFYTLWNNTFNYIPYMNLTNVGYSMVDTKNTTVFSENNGFVRSTFSNKKFSTNPLTITPSMNAPSYTGICNDNGNNISAANQAGLNSSPNRQMAVFYYNLNAVFSDAEYKALGKLTKIETFEPNNTTPIATKSLNYNSYPIIEAYDVSSLLNYQKEISKTVVLTCGTAANGTVPAAFFNCQGSCKDYENYVHYSSYSNTGSYLSSISETRDGITTTTNYNYDLKTAQLKDVTEVSPTDGKIMTTYQYAYENPVSPLCSKIGNESKLNQLSIPAVTRTYKGGLGSFNMSEFYLVNEVMDDGWDNVKTIREFNPASNQVNPNGCYYVNSSSNYRTNAVIPFQKYMGLVGTNMSGNSILNAHRPTGTSTLFSKNGRVLESYGLNNRYSAVKFGYNDLYPLASIQNAKYSSFGFTSFEDTVTVAPNVLHFGGEFTSGASRRAYNGSVKPHTGYYMSEVATQTSGPKTICRLFDANRTYEAKVWVHKSSPSTARLQINLKGQTTGQVQINTTVSVTKNDPANIQVGDWILMKCRLFVPPNLYFQDLSAAGYNLTPDLTISLENPSTTQSAFFDDLMFNPIDSPIEGNVYDLRTGRIISTLDDENFASFLNYDAAGRIISKYKETKAYGVIKISETEYNNCQSSLNMNQNTNTFNSN